MNFVGRKVFASTAENIGFIVVVSTSPSVLLSKLIPGCSGEHPYKHAEGIIHCVIALVALLCKEL